MEKGYFPKELPPPFKTTGYAEALAGIGSTVPTGIFNSRAKYSILCCHNLVRTGGLRRNLGIPNPKHFFLLADHIVTNWSSLKTIADQSSFSLTKPVDGRTDRAIEPEYPLSERTEKLAHLRSTSRFILKADITRFFPSIYTHSVPWAILGKAAAKAALVAGTLTGGWEDKTDLLSRNLNYRQTIGIPIGPDTSRLIAEVILSSIDVQLLNKYKKLIGIRYIDDYEFAFQTRSRAENVLGYLQHLLNEFELALNPNKTMIIELPDFFEKKWTSMIRRFFFREAGVTGQKNDLTAYFEIVFDFFKRYPEEGMMKYAIARMSSEDIYEDNWELFEAILVHCIRIEPACIPQVCDQVSHYKSEEFPINKNLWKKCLNKIVIEKAPLGQSSEVAWAMWLLKLLKIKLSSKAAKIAAGSEDSIVGLMALGLAASGLTKVRWLSELNRFQPNSGLFESQWLICYEGNLMSWLGPRSSRANLACDPAFLFLESKSVSFFDIGITPPEPVRRVFVTGGGGGGGGY